MARSVSFSPQLKKEYEERFGRMTIRPEYEDEVDIVVDKIKQHMDEYRKVEAATGVPAHVVGIIHIREASGRFDRHLHNGDPLTRRTVRVPEGRPPSGQPPFTWSASAIDALTMPGHELNEWEDWSVGGTAYVLERFNGFGYRLYHSSVPSPYLWGCTTEYTSGMYVADGKWDSGAVNRNPGGMAILKRMMERGILSGEVAEDKLTQEEAVEVIRGIQRLLIAAKVYSDSEGGDGDFGPNSRNGFNTVLRVAGQEEI